MNFTNSRSIQLLPEHLIDQIKAGEVIEKPASLLKELIENSIDAGATKISIQIINNGLDLISIEDNGKGISFEDLPYAFCRHATSKIASFDDVYNLISYGFRGEALASIASVSRLTCTSMPEHINLDGGKIIFHGGEQKSHSTFAQSSSGTSIYIKDLFYNTPARLKFIKSKSSEKNSINKILNSFILAHPEIRFSIKWDEKDKKIFEVITSTDYHQRAKTIFKNKGSELLEINHQYEGYKIFGLINPKSSKGSYKQNQYLFLNKRLFFDRSLSHITSNLMKQVWAFGEGGEYCIFLEVPPSKFDVNIHPGKTQIKFFQSHLISSLVSSSIKDILKNTTQINNNQYPTLAESTPSNFNFEKPYNNNSIYQSTATEEKESLFINRLENNFFTFTKENKVHIFSLDKYLQQLIESSLRKYSFNINEQNITPLLIGEPIKLEPSILSNFELIKPFLKDLGAEIDLLTPESIIVRTIPSWLNRLPIKEIIKSIILSLKQEHTITEEIFFKKILPNFKIEDSSSFSAHHINEIINSNLKEDTALRIINLNYIKSLFK